MRKYTYTFQYYYGNGPTRIGMVVNVAADDFDHALKKFKQHCADERSELCRSESEVVTSMVRSEVGCNMKHCRVLSVWLEIGADATILDAAQEAQTFCHDNGGCDVRFMFNELECLANKSTTWQTVVESYQKRFNERAMAHIKVVTAEPCFWCANVRAPWGHQVLTGRPFCSEICFKLYKQAEGLT